MKKFFALALVVLITVSCFAACGKSTDNPEETKKPSQNSIKTEENETNQNSTETSEPETTEKEEWPDESQYTAFHTFKAPEGKPREIVMDYMMKMATIEWTPAEDFTIKWEGTPSFSPDMALEFTAGKKYTGTAYGETHASFELFSQFLNENNEFKYENYSYENIIGNNCSTTMTLSYQQIVDMPISVLKPISSRIGLLSLANGLKIPEGKGDSWYSADVFLENGQQAIYDAYATLDSGDILYKSIKGTGHTRMVRKVETFTSPAGKLMPSKSYVYVVESTNAWFTDEKDTLWFIDKKYTFSDLYSTEFMPVTLDIYHEENPVYEDAYIAFDSTLTESLIQKSAMTGTVSSNFPLNYVSVTVTDENGNIADRVIEAALKDKYKVDLRKMYLNTKELPTGNYTLTLRAGIARGGADLQTLNFTIE